MSIRTAVNLAPFTIALLCTTACNEQTALDQPLEALEAAAEVWIYEGLPHQLREHALLQQELQRADIMQIGGFPFYTPKVAATTEQAGRLKKILGARNTYYIHRVPPTDCGPFHPDFAVTWMEGTTEHQLLLCFGCDEARFLADEQTLEYDLRSKKEIWTPSIPPVAGGLTFGLEKPNSFQFNKYLHLCPCLQLRAIYAQPPKKYGLFDASGLV